MKRMINIKDIEERIYGKTITQEIGEENTSLYIPSNKIDLTKGFIFHNISDTKYLFKVKYSVEDGEYQFWVYEWSNTHNSFLESGGEEVTDKLEGLSLNTDSNSYIDFGGHYYFQARDIVEVTYWESDTAFGGIEI